MNAKSNHTRWQVRQRIWEALVCVRTHEAQRMLAQIGHSSKH